MAYRIEAAGDACKGQQALAESPFAQQCTTLWDQHREVVGCAGRSPNYCSLPNIYMTEAQGVSDKRPSIELQPTQTATGSELLSTSVTDRAEIAKHLQNRANRLPVNYEDLLKGAQVIGWGDAHGMLAIKEAFKKDLKELKQAGVNQVGFELLPNTQAMRDKLNTYGDFVRANPNVSSDNPGLTEGQRRQLETAQKPLLDHFKDYWGDDDGHGTNQALVNMIDAAARLNLKVVPLEPAIPQAFSPIDGQGYGLVQDGFKQALKDSPELLDNFAGAHDSAQTAHYDRGRLQEYYEKAMGPVRAKELMAMLDTMRSSGFNFKSVLQGTEMWDEIHTWRNQVWASTIEQSLAGPDSGNRMVVAAGQGHFGFGGMDGNASTPSLNDVLAAHGYASTALEFTGGDYAADRERVHSFLDAEERKGSPIARPPDPQPWTDGDAAADAGLAGDRFAYRLRSEAPRPADIVIHLPESSPDRSH